MPAGGAGGKSRLLLGKARREAASPPAKVGEESSGDTPLRKEMFEDEQ